MKILTESKRKEFIKKIWKIRAMKENNDRSEMKKNRPNLVWEKNENKNAQTAVLKLFRDPGKNRSRHF